MESRRISSAPDAAPKPWPTLWLLIAIAAINLTLCLATVHVFRTTAYVTAGDMRYLVVAAVIVNILTAGLPVHFHWRFRWRQGFAAVLAAECFVSGVTFALVRVLRIPASDFRTHVIGTVYALFIYLHLGALLIFSFKNQAGEASERSSTTAFRIWIFAVSLLIYGALTPWAKIACFPTADEPHYLLLTHSLVFDHDFDLANNYARGDYRRFYPAKIDHHTVTNARGQELPVHDVGISVLLVPGYAMAGRLGAMFELDIFGALLALGMFVVGMKLGAAPRAALTAWALFAFTSPLAIYSSQIYPEIVGAGLVTWAVVAHIRFTESRKWRYLWLAALALALLPWFSIRYWFLLGPMLAVMALHVMMPIQSGRYIVLKGLVVIFLPLLVSVALFGAFDSYYYQTLTPNAGYVLFMRHRPSLFTLHFLPGFAGLLFDRAFGLLTTAPVYLLAFAGCWVLWQRQRWQGALVISPAAAYVLLAALNRFWYGGWAPPPRYIVSGIAVLAPVAGLVLSRRTPRVLLLVLSAWSFFIAIAYTAFTQTRYTYWNVNTGALSDFLASTIGFHFGAVFPSLIRASSWDYLLCVIWGLAALGCLWLLVGSAPTNQQHGDTGEVLLGAIQPRATGQ
jgi:hypothetical protein